MNQNGHVILAGQRYRVVRDSDGRRFINGEEPHAFIERMEGLGRFDVVRDLARIGQLALGQKLDFGSARQTAFALHQARTRAN